MNVRLSFSRSITTKNTYYNGNKLNNVITEKVAILNNIHAKLINVTNAKLNNMNGINVTRLIEDTVFKGDKSTISGRKEFTNLTITEANVTNGINMSQILNQIKGTVILLSNLDLPPVNITIKNLEVVYFMNDIPMDKITSGRMCEDIIVTGEQKFDNLTSMKNIFIKGNKLNGFDINHITDDALKINESFEFDTVHLGE